MTAFGNNRKSPHKESIKAAHSLGLGLALGIKSYPRVILNTFCTLHWTHSIYGEGKRAVQEVVKHFSPAWKNLGLINTIYVSSMKISNLRDGVWIYKASILTSSIS